MKLLYITEEMAEQLAEEYYQDNEKKIRQLVDKILFKLKFDVDYDDFYSLANEVFVKDVLQNYDGKQDFNGFLYSCLEKKFKTEMTRRTRDKRCVKIIVEDMDEDGNKVMKKEIIPDARIDAPIGDEENSILGDMIADPKTVETEIFKTDKKEWRKEIKEYLEKLSPLQRKIAILLSDNNTPDEICEELHITMKHFENSVKRILADEKIRPLRPLVERM